MDINKTIENYKNLKHFYEWNKKDVILISISHIDLGSSLPHI